MGATEVGLLERLFALAISPAGGALFLGIIVGLALMYWLMTKHVMPVRLKISEDLCAARIEALNARLAKVEPIARRWERFMERKAFEALGDKPNLDDTLN